MRRCWGVSRAVLVAAAGLAGLGVGQTAYSQPARLQAVNRDVLRQAAKLIQTEFQREASSLGFGTAEAVPASKKVWAAALQVPGVISSGVAGFSLPPLGVEGTSLPGAKATATFTVLEVKGPVVLSLKVLEAGTNKVVGEQSKFGITQLGQVTLTTPEFVLEAGKKYKVKAQLAVYSAHMWDQGACAAVGTVDAIHWLI